MGLPFYIGECDAVSGHITIKNDAANQGHFGCKLSGGVENLGCFIIAVVVIAQQGKLHISQIFIGV